MSPQKWKLISKKDISPSPWFPLENRTYELPNGHIVDDFFVTTIADAVMIVPITKDKKVVLVNQYKPGLDEVVLEFPAGRLETNDTDRMTRAMHELEEETGISVARDALHPLAVLSAFPTKGSEKLHIYLTYDLEFNASQKLDVTEDIEVVTFTFAEFENAIATGKVWNAGTIAAWQLVKMKYPQVLDQHR
ncbi:MAG: NUDIX hydrolase [Candidatus Roizmanbacteria bacterium]